MINRVSQLIIQNNIKIKPISHKLFLKNNPSFKSIGIKNKVKKNSISLLRPDKLFQTNKLPIISPKRDILPISFFSKEIGFDNKMFDIKSLANNEWSKNIKETHGKDRSPRIDQYAKASNFGVGKAWCGFFVGFCYKNKGFKHTSSLASYQKARDFFMYRSYTNKSQSKNEELDNLRLQQESSGNSRKYFMLNESVNHKYINNYKKHFSHYNPNENTFNYINLPIKSGDVALFSRGHVGMVDSYNPKTGILKTVEGNATGSGPNGKKQHGVVKKTYDLRNPTIRAKFDGFGRPSPLDFK